MFKAQVSAVREIAVFTSEGFTDANADVSQVDGFLEIAFQHGPQNVIGECDWWIKFKDTPISIFIV